MIRFFAKMDPPTGEDHFVDRHYKIFCKTPLLGETHFEDRHAVFFVIDTYLRENYSLLR